MKMKKMIAIAVSAALMVSMAAATAFAVESTPSKTGTDADAGKPNYTISGTGDGLEIKVEVTGASESEETSLKNAGGNLSVYANAQAADTAAKLLGTKVENVTVNEVKQLKVSGYETGMGKVSMSVPFAALPVKGTKVAVLIKVVNNGSVNWITVPGVVEEKVFAGSTKAVRCVTFALDDVTMVNVQAGTATVAAVIGK